MSTNHASCHYKTSSLFSYPPFRTVAHCTYLNLKVDNLYIFVQQYNVTVLNIKP